MNVNNIHPYNTFLWSDVEDKCGICLKAPKQDSEWVAHEGPGTKHPFHKKCAKKVLKDNDNCPVCRVKVSMVGIETIGTIEERNRRIAGMEERQVTRREIIEGREAARRERREGREAVRRERREITEAREAARREITEVREAARREITEAREAARREIAEAREEARRIG